MSKALTQWPRVRFMDANGAPLSGGKIYTYLTGTSTPKTTYSNATGTANANPVVLDSEGYADVWLDGDYAYRFRLENSAGALQWQRDNIGAAAGAQVSTLADLRNSTGGAEGEVIRMLGYAANGDGGGGEWFWSASSTAADNAGTIVDPSAAGAGRWLRLFSGPVNVKWFGAKGDGATNDSDAFQDAIDYVDSLGGGQIDVPFESGETYKANIVIADRRGVHLHGTGWTKQSYASGSTEITRCIKPYDVTLPVIRIGDDSGTSSLTLTSGTMLSNLTLCGTGASRGQIGLKIIGGAYRCVYDNISILGFTLKGIYVVVASTKFAYYQFFTGLSVICADAGAACIYLDGSGNGAGGSTNVTSFFFDKVTIATGTDATCRGIVVKSAQATFSDTYVQLSNSRHDIGLELIQVGTEAAPNVTGNNLIIDGVGRFEDNNGSPIYRGIPTVFMNIPAVTVAGQKPISNYLRGSFTIDGLIRLSDSGVPAVTIDPEVYEGSAVMSDQVSPANFGAYSWFRSPIMTDGKVANKLYFVNLINPELTNLYVSAGTGVTPQLTFTAPTGVNVTTHWSVNGYQVVGARVTGWATTYAGSATRSTFDTTTVTTAQLAERVKALLDDLITHGLIGAA